MRAPAAHLLQKRRDSLLLRLAGAREFRDETQLQEVAREIVFSAFPMVGIGPAPPEEFPRPAQTGGLICCPARASLSPFRSGRRKAYHDDELILSCHPSGAALFRRCPRPTHHS